MTLNTVNDERYYSIKEINEAAVLAGTVVCQPTTSSFGKTLDFENNTMFF